MAVEPRFQDQLLTSMIPLKVNSANFSGCVMKTTNFEDVENLNKIFGLTGFRS